MIVDMCRLKVAHFHDKNESALRPNLGGTDRMFGHRHPIWSSSTSKIIKFTLTIRQRCVKSKTELIETHLRKHQQLRIKDPLLRAAHGIVDWSCLWGRNCVWLLGVWPPKPVSTYCVIDCTRPYGCDQAPCSADSVQGELQINLSLSKVPLGV